MVAQCISIYDRTTSCPRSAARGQCQRYNFNNMIISYSDLLPVCLPQTPGHLNSQCEDSPGNREDRKVSQQISPNVIRSLHVLSDKSFCAGDTGPVSWVRAHLEVCQRSQVWRRAKWMRRGGGCDLLKSTGQCIHYLPVYQMYQLVINHFRERCTQLSSIVSEVFGWET